MCVNALSRAGIISTRALVNFVIDGKECQCPKSGGDHFYKHVIQPMLGESRCVNALSRAGIISTLKNLKKKSLKKRVNALSRAGIISTNL